MSLRRLLILLLLVLAPLPIAAAEPAWACSCVVAAGPQQVKPTTSDGRAACGYRFDPSGECRVTEALPAAINHRERAERLSAYRSMVFWSGSTVVLLAVIGGLAWVMTLPGGRVAAVSGQEVAPRPGDDLDPAVRTKRRTK